MRPTAFTLLIFVLLSCRKEIIPSIEERVTGKWELRTRAGTIVGIDETFAPGNGTILQFGNGEYAKYLNAQLVEDGTFLIKEDNTTFNIAGYRLTFHTNSSTTIKFMILADSSLSLHDYGADAEVDRYRRLQ